MTAHASLAHLSDTVYRYSYERLCFDRWAAWADGQWEQLLGLPSETTLSKVAHFGIRVGVARAGSEPDIHDEPVIVSAIMEEWAVAPEFEIRQSHSALMARHRRVIGGVKITQLTDAQGKPRRFPDHEMAVLVLGSGGEKGKKRFQRLCVRGYEELRTRLLRILAPVQVIPPR